MLSLSHIQTFLMSWPSMELRELSKWWKKELLVEGLLVGEKSYSQYHQLMVVGEFSSPLNDLLKEPIPRRPTQTEPRGPLYPLLFSTDPKAQTEGSMI